jgi:hypothetical protein
MPTCWRSSRDRSRLVIAVIARRNAPKQPRIPCIILDCFVANAPRNDESMHSLSRGAHASELSNWISLLKTEGAGKTGHRPAPMVRVQQESTRQNHRLSREYPAFPARMVLTAASCSPQGPAFLPLSPACSSKHRELNLSTGRPGPHDLTVRIASFVGMTRDHAATRYAHCIPTPRIVTTARTPLVSRQDGAT